MKDPSGEALQGQERPVGRFLRVKSHQRTAWRGLRRKLRVQQRVVPACSSTEAQARGTARVPRSVKIRQRREGMRATAPPQSLMPKRKWSLGAIQGQKSTRPHSSHLWLRRALIKGGRRRPARALNHRHPENAPKQTANARAMDLYCRNEDASPPACVYPRGPQRCPCIDVSSF